MDLTTTLITCALVGAYIFSGLALFFAAWGVLTVAVRVRDTTRAYRYCGVHRLPEGAPAQSWVAPSVRTELMPIIPTDPAWPVTLSDQPADHWTPAAGPLGAAP